MVLASRRVFEADGVKVPFGVWVVDEPGRGSVSALSPVCYGRTEMADHFFASISPSLPTGSAQAGTEYGLAPGTHTSDHRHSQLDRVPDLPPVHKDA